MVVISCNFLRNYLLGCIKRNICFTQKWDHEAVLNLDHSPVTTSSKIISDVFFKSITFLEEHLWFLWLKKNTYPKNDLTVVQRTDFPNTTHPAALPLRSPWRWSRGAAQGQRGRRPRDEPREFEGGAQGSLGWWVGWLFFFFFFFGGGGGVLGEFWGILLGWSGGSSEIAVFFGWFMSYFSRWKNHWVEFNRNSFIEMDSLFFPFPLLTLVSFCLTHCSLTAHESPGRCNPLGQSCQEAPG